MKFGRNQDLQSVNGVKAAGLARSQTLIGGPYGDMIATESFLMTYNDSSF